MIDKIVFYIKDVDIDALEKRIPELDIIGLDKKRGVSKYGATLKGVITIIIDGKRLLRGFGSLHKFAKGNNYSLFTINEARNAIIEIGEILGISLDQINLTLIEIGLNISMTKDPMRYIEMIHSYGIKKKRPFIYMRPLKRSNKLRGRLCQFTEYVIKFYDKTFEAGYTLTKAEKELIPLYLLRYEIELHPKQYRMTGFKNIKPMTAQRLLNYRVYSRFIRLLRQVLEKIELKDFGEKHTEKLFEDIKSYIFVTSEGYETYRNFLVEYPSKEADKEYKAIKKLKKYLEKDFESIKETENVLELKSKFEDTIEKVSDYKHLKD